MNLRLAISGAIWAAILVIALQFVPTPAAAHTGHAHRGGVVSALAHHLHGADAVHHASTHRAVQPLSQPSNLSATPDPTGDADVVDACAGSCCGAGAGCCGAALIGFPAELPNIGAAVRCRAPIDHRRSGVDPDGLARPPRTLAA